MAQPRRILIIEDDPGIASGLVRGLRGAGYACELCLDGASGMRQMLAGGFDLVVLDMMLPERDGYELLEARRGRSSVPVLVLTARTELDDRLRSFELGAADWMSKPFFMDELLARIRARLGEARPSSRRELRWGEVRLDLDRRLVRVGERDAELTAHEFNLLATLVQNPGRVMSRRQLAEAALPVDGRRSDRTLNSHIARIRKKLGVAGEALQTVRGVGYCFEPSEASRP
ncbi:DNA-binding reponse regulator [Plesiocystis pacifica SIR-1]|uniref:DNA-binding reponse regulator n=1 Tax=Plesiocystis pacifica SIR-1 TaxID=391625 RepID=A6G574_9BACT|nr:response regulator transcription factor [Plesiocystis pacifica]EDM78986.1 DNA-binding reponse regulator [Plesiocystis pacifica SIR-1]